MQLHALEGPNGASVELDLCFQCQGIWIDPKENLMLAPASVAELFTLLHQHRDDEKSPLAQRLDCPRCKGALRQGFDQVRTGRYITYRCGATCGRFSSFSSFMIEKGFVRQLSRTEVNDIAKRVGAINCSNCGAAVDLRKDDACQHCRTALSLLDPDAVEKALKGYAKASTTKAAQGEDVADALIALERERSTARGARTHQAMAGSSGPDIDLWAVGVAIVAAMFTAH